MNKNRVFGYHFNLYLIPHSLVPKIAVYLQYPKRSRLGKSACEKCDALAVCCKARLMVQSGQKYSFVFALRLLDIHKKKTNTHAFGRKNHVLYSDTKMTDNEFVVSEKSGVENGSIW